MPRERLAIERGITPIWRTQPAPELPSWQALLTPVVANAFHDLQVAVALWLTGDYWHTITTNTLPDVLRFEAELGVERRRWDYNQRVFERIHRDRCVLRGEHAGFHNLFVPLLDQSGVRGVIVSGPFALSRPTSAELLERWYWMAGAQGRLTDPIFSDYVRATLATLTLDGSLYESFERLMSCFGELASGRGNAQALASKAEEMRDKVLRARFAEYMWRAGRGMVGERAGHIWASPDRARSLEYVGLKSVPEHVVVGLLLGKVDEHDPLDDLLRRDAFQRACVTLATKLGDTICTPVGDHGVAFLVNHTGSAARTRARLTDAANRAASLARRFGFKLHSGLCEVSDAPTLAGRYRAALWAAEKALSRGENLVRGEPRPERSSKHLRKLRAELAASVGERSPTLATHFDQYVEAVLVHCGYRLGPVRTQLDAALERIVEPVLASGALDEKTFDELCAAVEDGTEAAETIAGLVEPYRELYAELERAMQNSTLARQDRGTRRALGFIREHLSEPLTLAQVARAAGFAPDYFSRIFKRNEGVTFEQYAQRLRVERAKQMLRSTTLSIEGVRQLSGFSTRSYFHRVFKQAVGVTPVEYRERGAGP